MKKNKNQILIIGGVAVVAYLLYRKWANSTPYGPKGPNGFTSKIMEKTEEPVTDAATAVTEDGTAATAMTTESGETAIQLPGGIKITPAQAKKLKGKLKTAAITALAKLKSKKRKKQSETAVAGFQNLPILF